MKLLICLGTGISSALALGLHIDLATDQTVMLATTIALFTYIIDTILCP